MRRTERCNPPDGATFPDSIMSNIPRQGTATLAVLIDADNAAPAIVEGLLAEVAKYGVAAVKRIYGDWTKPNLAGWKEKLLSHSIQPIQQFRYTVGKNATDSAMIIDAMDLLYTGRFHGFCIVSSDSDFTRLASRIREQGLIVYGFGERKTPKPFVTACDKFIYSDVLRAEVEAEGAAAPRAAAAPASCARTRVSCGCCRTPRRQYRTMTDGPRSAASATISPSRRPSSTRATTGTASCPNWCLPPSCSRWKRVTAATTRPSGFA